MARVSLATVAHIPHLVPIAPALAEMAEWVRIKTTSSGDCTSGAGLHLPILSSFFLFFSSSFFLSPPPFLPLSWRPQCLVLQPVAGLALSQPLPWVRVHALPDGSLVHGCMCH